MHNTYHPLEAWDFPYHDIMQHGIYVRSLTYEVSTDDQSFNTQRHCQYIECHMPHGRGRIVMTAVQAHTESEHVELDVATSTSSTQALLATQNSEGQAYSNWMAYPGPFTSPHRRQSLSIPSPFGGGSSHTPDGYSPAGGTPTASTNGCLGDNEEGTHVHTHVP